MQIFLFLNIFKFLLFLLRLFFKLLLLIIFLIVSTLYLPPLLTTRFLSIYILLALIKMTIPEHQQAMTSQTGEKGFTLMELLVVIGIIIVIAASVLTVIPGMSQKAKKKATKAFINRLEIALEQYYNDNRSYPPTGSEPTGIEDLKMALQPPDDALKQYIEFDDSEVNGNDIVDFWGNPFVYATTGTQNTGSYDLYSTGPDGITSSSGSDADDINNWKNKPKRVIVSYFLS